MFTKLITIPATLLLLGFIGSSYGATCESTGNTDTPLSRFIINTDQGTAIDRTTNLMWKRCIERMSGPQCTYSEGESSGSLGFNWSGAVLHAEQHEFAGKFDWRIPNVIELMSIFDYQCYNSNGSKENHGINYSVFPMDDLADLALSIWTSSYPSDSEMNININYFSLPASNFSGAKSRYRTELSNIRLVREVTPNEFEPELTLGGK